MKSLQGGQSDALPSGWSWTRLGDLGNYWNGRGFRKSEWRHAGRQIIRIQDLTGTRDKPNYFQGDVDDRHIVKRGDLLVSWAATLSVYLWRGDEAVLNQHIFKVDSFINKDFHRYLLSYILGELQRQTHGSGMVHITRGRFESTRVPVPPLLEQGRIVAAIEEQFSRIDAGVSALQRARRNVQRMRAAVLQAAVVGGLVPPGPEDEPAEVMLKRILEERRDRWYAERRSATYRESLPLEPDGLPRPAHWAVASLEQLTDPVRVICYGILKPRVPNGTVPYVEVRDLAKQVLRRDELNRTSEALHREFRRSTLKENDVLLAIRGSYDRAAVVPAAVSGANISRDVARIAPLPGLDPRFLRLFLIAPRTLADLASKARGVGVKGVNIGDIRRMAVPIPPGEEQGRIVEQAARILSLVDGLSQEISAAMKRGATLRRALLDHAFGGRLVPQDPSDEPASALLDHIRVARVVNGSASDRPRRRLRR